MNMPKHWSVSYEMEYWYKYSPVFYINKIIKKLQSFGKVEIKPEYNVADIGGGAYGGCLSLINHCNNKILLDACGKEFIKLGTVPNYISIINCNFVDIPIKDCFFDVVFATEVFDHANNISDHRLGQSEAVRILKYGGKLYTTVLYRKEATDGHNGCISHDKEYVKGFDNCNVLHRHKIDQYEEAFVLQKNFTV